VPNYMVTGAAGFIGARVVGLLLERGHHVLGIDNLNDAYDVRLKSWRLDRLKAHPAFSFRLADIASPEALAQAWGEGNYQAVINLAARAGVRPSMRQPEAYVRANLIGALNVLELCRTHGVATLVQASTSSLYGAHNPRPFKEDADISRPLSPYAASKGAAELMCHAYHHLYGLNVTILRYFTVYGPAGRPDMVLFRAIQRIAEGQTLEIFGDGQQERDFTFVDDIARGTVAALDVSGFHTINLGGDQPHSLMHVLGLLEGIIGRKARLAFKDRAPGDVLATWADIDQAGKLLGWEPQIPLEPGLEAAVAWYREQQAWAKDVATSD
jgi:UDP-glucuronate 4-epimerase